MNRGEILGAHNGELNFNDIDSILSNGTPSHTLETLLLSYSNVITLPSSDAYIEFDIHTHIWNKKL